MWRDCMMKLQLQALTCAANNLYSSLHLHFHTLQLQCMTYFPLFFFSFLIWHLEETVCVKGIFPALEEVCGVSKNAVCGDQRRLSARSSWDGFYSPPLPAGGEHWGSVGHLLCVCCRSDDETGTASLNLCIGDELSPLFISHHHILQPDKLSLSCQTPRPQSAHTGMHMYAHVHPDAQAHTHTHTLRHMFWTNIGIIIVTPICMGQTHTHSCRFFFFPPSLVVLLIISCSI